VRDNLLLVVLLTAVAGQRKIKQLLSLLSLQEFSAMLCRTESMDSNLPSP